MRYIAVGASGCHQRRAEGRRLFGDAVAIFALPDQVLRAGIGGGASHFKFGETFPYLI